MDDDPDDVFILTRLLVKAETKNKTLTFAEPKTAIVYLEGAIKSGEPLNLPCLTFTDLNMPDLDGVEFARWFRAQPRLAEKRLVMVTSSEDPADQRRAQEARIDQFLPKYPSLAVIKGLVATSNCH